MDTIEGLMSGAPSSFHETYQSSLRLGQIFKFNYHMIFDMKGFYFILYSNFYTILLFLIAPFGKSFSIL